MINYKVAIAIGVVTIGLSLIAPPMKYPVNFLDFDLGRSETIGNIVVLMPLWATNPHEGVRVTPVPDAPRRSGASSGVVVIPQKIDDEPAGEFALDVWVLWEVVPISILATVIGRVKRRRAPAPA